MTFTPRTTLRPALVLAVAALFNGAAPAQTAPISTSDLYAQSQAQVQPLLDTLKSLVAIESGSRDLEGLAKVADVVAGRLKAAGLDVKLIPAKAPDFHPQLKGAPVGSMVYATRAGRGQRKVLLIAHMDTVYTRGMGEMQPFRVEGDKAYGLGIADDKSGVALILHTVEQLQRIGFDDYAQLGVLINADEEIGSPGSGATITQLGSEYDAVFSFEGGGSTRDVVRLATSSIAIAELKITGRASHAGANPEGGRNALYEMAHQILQTRNLGEPDKGLKINWTVGNSGETRNVIPASAMAVADMRALADADMDRLEAALRKSLDDKLIPDTKAELSFYRSRPAFQANAASRVLAQHALTVFKDIGLPLDVQDRASGGGTDAAFAGQRPKGGVLESFGLRGYGAHSNDNEYVHIPSIAPRLTLATKMVMDVGSGAVRW